MSDRSKPKGVRLGYMGHLTLISEDVISALSLYPPELTATLAQYAPQPQWDAYVSGRFKETKDRDTSQLGGGKPALGGGPRLSGGLGAGGIAAVDEAEGVSIGDNAAALGGGVLTRTVSNAASGIGASPASTSGGRPSSQNVVFAALNEDEEEDEFARRRDGGGGGSQSSEVRTTVPFL